MDRRDQGVGHRELREKGDQRFPLGRSKTSRELLLVALTEIEDAIYELAPLRYQMQLPQAAVSRANTPLD